MRVLEDEVLRSIFGLKRDVIIGGRRELRSEDFRMIKLRRIR
jgi:hypothetical protein